jgi:hypothetical protein
MTRYNRQSRKDMTYRQSVQAFLSTVDELKERPFIIDGLYEFHFHISVDEGAGQITCEMQEGDQEHFRSFLLTFRKFILNDEPSNVDWILNICRRFVLDDKKELIEVLDGLKAVWGYRYRKGVVQMRTNDLDLTPEYVLDLWINGQYFHGDNPQKKHKLKALLSQDIPSVKIQLLWALPLLTDIILRIGAVVSQGLDEGAFDFE